MISKKMIIMMAIVTVIASLIGAMVVYAAITINLNITGTAEFQPEIRDVKINESSLSSPILTGGAKIQIAPTLSDTAISDFKITLTQPGDSAAYTFYIKNTGNLDYVLSTYSSSTPSCIGTGDSKAEDETLVCSNLLYTLKYVGGDLATNGLTSGEIVTQGDQLKSQTEVQLELNLLYSNEVTVTPQAVVTIDGLDKTLIYSTYQ